MFNDAQDHASETPTPISRWSHLFLFFFTAAILIAGLAMSLFAQEEKNEATTDPVPTAESALPPVTTPIPSQTPETPAALQVRENELLRQLATIRMEDPDYRTKLEQIGQELREIQTRLQSFQTTDAMNAPFTPSAPNPAFSPITDGGTPPQNFPTTSPVAPLNDLDKNYFLQLRDELNSQLKQLQQTLDVLGPKDAALTESLKEQQMEILSQLKEVNSRLDASGMSGPQEEETTIPDPKSEPAFPSAENAHFPDLSSSNPAPAPTGPTGESNPDAFRLPPNSPITPDLTSKGEAFPTGPLNLAAERVRKANEAAALLQEAGLNQLANSVIRQTSALSDPNYVETANDSEELENPWFENSNKNKEILAQITELKKENEETRKALAEITEELKNVETQLKLLSRQAVSSGNGQ